MSDNKIFDVVLDTDAYNEIDDQFAIAYLLRSKERLNTKAIYAAPFYNTKSSGPEDGMIKSYDEILKVVDLCGEESLKKSVFKGSVSYLADEKTPVYSEAAIDLSKRAMNYTKENPLYVVGIAAVTNIASAILINPEIVNRIVIVWLGGNARHWEDTNEFNMAQDIAAARIVMGCGARLVQLPCIGVVSHFTISGPEIKYWLENKNPLADYLAKNTLKEVENVPCDVPWTRIIWDVTAVAWLLNDNNRFMKSCELNVHLPGYDNLYEERELDNKFTYVRYIIRDALMKDLIDKLLK